MIISSLIQDSFERRSLGNPLEIALEDYDYSLLPVTHISIHNANNVTPASSELLFYYKALKQALHSFQTRKFTEFDGHTTSTCCHGLALYVYDTIQSLRSIDINEVLQTVNEVLRSPEDKLQVVEFPASVVKLTRLYICNYIKRRDPNNPSRIITRTKNLQEIAPVSTNFCNRICHELQKDLSNTVALRYAKLAELLHPEMKIANVPLIYWARYVQNEHIRTDKRGVMYAPCMYSMQVVLAYLSANRSKLAILCDTMQLGEKESRYLCLLEGDGNGGFRQVDHQTILSDQSEPVVIFGGLTNQSLAQSNEQYKKLNVWKNHISELVLSCDIHYPQFPKPVDDCFFDSTNIQPTEKLIIQALEKAKKVQGVAIDDPSLFCLTHIFSASLNEVVDVLSNNIEALPYSLFPVLKNLQNST